MWSFQKTEEMKKSGKPRRWLCAAGIWSCCRHSRGQRGAPHPRTQKPHLPRQAAHLEPLSDPLGDADGELRYLGRTRFAFLAVRLVLGLRFHNHLVRETEKQRVRGTVGCLQTHLPREDEDGRGDPGGQVTMSPASASQKEQEQLPFAGNLCARTFREMTHE